MRVSFDGMIMNIQPDALNWEPPRVIARDGDYAPVVGKFWSCRLSMGRMVEPSLNDWQALIATTTVALPNHTAILPHPFNGVMTSFSCYVDNITPRMDVSDQSDHCAVVAGFDVTLSGILVT